MDAPTFTDSQGRALTARTWGRLHNADADVSTVQIVANDIYNTPRDHSPNPAARADGPSPLPTELSVKVRRLSQATRQPRTSTIKDAGPPGRPSVVNSRAGPSKPAAQARPSARSPEAGKSPKGKASSAARTASSAAKPAWADVPATPPARSAVKASVETVTAPPGRRATKESSRPERTRMSIKPPVPTLNLKGAPRRTSGSKNVPSAAVHSSQSLDAQDSSSSFAAESQTPPPLSTPRLSAYSARSSARLGSQRTARALPDSLPLERRTSSMKVELPQTRCASMDVQDAEEALMGQLGEVASAVPPTGHADLHQDDIPNEAYSLDPILSHSSNASTAGMPIQSPPASSRFGKQRGGDGSPRTDVNSFKGSKEAIPGPRPAHRQEDEEAQSSRHAAASIALDSPRAVDNTYLRTSGADFSRLGTPRAGHDSSAQEAANCKARSPSITVHAYSATTGRTLDEIQEESPISPRLATHRSTRDSNRASNAASHPEVAAASKSTPRAISKEPADPVRTQMGQREDQTPCTSIRKAEDSWAEHGLAHTQSGPGKLVASFGEGLGLDKATSLPASLRAAANLLSRRSFLSLPGPTTAPVRCSILRDLTKRGRPVYLLYLDDPAKLILTARKRRNSKIASYAIFVDTQDLPEQGHAQCGRVSSNFLGTQFAVFEDDRHSEGAGKGNFSQKLILHRFEHGKSLANAAGSDGGEVGLVRYQTNILGTRGPRKMTVLIPKRQDSKGPTSGPTALKGSMTQRLKSKDTQDQCLTLMNKPPKWNDQLGAFCLNFGGRVTHASVKNFQLVSEDDREAIILQFGKVGKDKFSMDFRWPMSTLQAFGICLSSFESKLACE